MGLIALASPLEGPASRPGPAGALGPRTHSFPAAWAGACLFVPLFFSAGGPWSWVPRICADLLHPSPLISRFMHCRTSAPLSLASSDSRACPPCLLRLGPWPTPILPSGRKPLVQFIEIVLCTHRWQSCCQVSSHLTTCRIGWKFGGPSSSHRHEMSASDWPGYERGHESPGT